MNEEPTIRTAQFNIDTPRLRSQMVTAASVFFALIWFVVTFAFVVFGLYFQKYVFPAERKLFGLAAFTLVPLYFAFTFGLSAVRNLRRSFLRIRSIPGACDYSATFTESRLTFDTGAGVHGSMPYSVLAKLAPEKQGIMIHIDPLRVLWVPKESFSTSQEFETASTWCLNAQLAKAALAK